MSKIKYFEIGSYVTEPQSGDIGKVIEYHQDGRINIKWITGNSKGYDIPVNKDILEKYPYEPTFIDYTIFIVVHVVIPVLLGFFILYLIF